MAQPVQWDSALIVGPRRSQIRSGISSSEEVAIRVLSETPSWTGEYSEPPSPESGCLILTQIKALISILKEEVLHHTQPSLIAYVLMQVEPIKGMSFTFFFHTNSTIQITL